MPLLVSPGIGFFPQPALLRSEADNYFLPAFHRFVNGVDYLQRPATFDPVDHRMAMFADTSNHILNEQQMAESINVGRGARAIQRAIVPGLVVGELPRFHF